MINFHTLNKIENSLIAEVFVRFLARLSFSFLLHNQNNFSGILEQTEDLKFCIKISSPDLKHKPQQMFPVLKYKLTKLHFYRHLGQK
jgi:hypothetical protein